MGPVNHLPLRNVLLRAVAATCRETAGVNQSNHTAALRSSGIAARRPQALPQPPQHSVFGSCVRSGASSDGLVYFNPRASHKRPLGRRTLSVRTPNSASESGSNNSNNNNNTRCWKCQSTVGWREYFCKCGATQLLDEHLDYFEMFDCPPSVFLELSEVEKRFKKMQRAFHPVSASRYHLPYLTAWCRLGRSVCSPTRAVQIRRCRFCRSSNSFFI